MKISTKVIIGAVVILGLFWLVSQLQMSCGSLEHVNLDQMDSATKSFYFQNCR